LSADDQAVVGLRRVVKTCDLAVAYCMCVFVK